MGKASGNLCAIDVDSDARADEFEKLNPVLAKTFQSKGARGRNFWVVVRGAYPELHKIKAGTEAWGEWRGDGGQTVVYGRHPNGFNYTYPNPGKPAVEINFADIVWPEDTDRPWEAEEAQRRRCDIEKRHGEPFKLKVTEEDVVVVGVNESYWAASYQEQNRVLYEPCEKKFYQYEPDTGLWDIKSEDVIKQEISRDILEQGRINNQPATQHMRSDRLLSGITRQLRGMVEVRDAFTSKAAHGVHCANVYLTFDPDGGIHQQEFSPDFFSRNQSPIEYRGIDLVPERFLNELVIPTLYCEEDIELFQKYGGMCLYGRNLIQRFMVLFGQAGGGKSTLVNIILLVVGKHNMASLRTGHLNNQFELFRFRAKTLLSGTDVPGNFLSTPGAKVIKGLTGGDTMEAEGKGLNDGVVLQGIFNILITANERLKVALEGDVDAWGRRLILLEFGKPPPAKKVDRFAEKLVEDEGPAILAWFLRGLQKLLVEVGNGGDVVIGERQRKKIENLLAESDSVTHFITDRVRKAPGKSVTNEEFITLYGEYCAERGWVAMEQARLQRVINQKMLELRQVTQSHSVETRGRGKRGFRGISVDGQMEAGEYYGD
jgi:phage/plasmid-associated DNA primase